MCRPSGKCISQSLVCNGDQDCEEDGLDEQCHGHKFIICTKSTLPPNIELLGLGWVTKLSPHTPQKWIQSNRNASAKYLSTLIFLFKTLLQVRRGVRNEERQRPQHKELWGPVPSNVQRRPPNTLQAAPQHTPVQLHGGSPWTVAQHGSTRTTTFCSRFIFRVTILCILMSTSSKERRITAYLGTF